MIIFIVLISQNLLYAFNEDLTAVHYSIVTPGIDEEIKPGMSHTRYAAYGFTKIKVQHSERII